MNEDRDQAIAAGFQLHISKPIDTTALIAAITNLTASVVDESIS